MKSMCQDPPTSFRTWSVRTHRLQGTGIPGHMHCSAGTGQPRTRASLGKHLAPNAPKMGSHPSVSGGAVKAPLHKHIMLKDQPPTRHEGRRVRSWTGLNVFHCFRRISACQHAGGCMSRTVGRGDKMSTSPSSQSETPLSVRGPQLWAAEVTVSRRGGEGSPWLFTR